MIRTFIRPHVIENDLEPLERPIRAKKIALSRNGVVLSDELSICCSETLASDHTTTNLYRDG